MSILKLNLKKQISNSDRVSIIDNSFKSLGFLVITNHPTINKELIDNAYEEAKALFLESKAKLLKNFQITYTSFGQEHAKDSQMHDLKEFFHIKDSYRLNHRSYISDLMNELNKLGLSLLEDCATAMGCPSNTTLSNSTYNGNTILRVLHYPPILEPTDNVRAAPHEDINLLTLLVAATNPGLQVKDHNGNWINVETNPNDIVVNVGDMLQSYSNGYYKSTTHQVVNVDTANSRYSMPYFIHPRNEFNISPRLHMIEKTGVAKYKKQSAGEYLEERLQEIGLK